jgi:peptide-methionine (S)-S-oxide reductase
MAIDSKKEASKSGYWKSEIITEITEIYNYSDAEDYHNNYYDNNPNQPYCVYVIKPKLDKLVEKGIIE